MPQNESRKMVAEHEELAEKRSPDAADAIDVEIAGNGRNYFSGGWACDENCLSSSFLFTVYSRKCGETFQSLWEWDELCLPSLFQLSILTA